MALLPILISWTVVFAIEWFLLGWFDDNTGRAGIVAFCVAASCLAYRLHEWNSTQLRLIKWKKVTDYFLLFFTALVASFAADFYFGGVRFQDLAKWSNLLRPGDPVRFLTSAFVGVFGSAIFVGVLIEVIVLKRIVTSGYDSAAAIKGPYSKIEVLSAPRWVRFIDGTPRLSVLVACVPILYAMHLAKDSQHVLATLVTLAWLPCYVWLLNAFNKWKVVRWPFSIVGTIILVALSAMVIFPYG
jgi:hypothetical protein